MEFPNDKIESCFRKALSGKSIDIYNLICAYLEDKDNPDSIERAYQLTLRMRNMVDQTIQQKEIRCELTTIFKRFLLGYHGFKYIDFPYYWNFNSKTALHDVKVLSSELTSIQDKHWGSWIEACKSFTNRNDNVTTMSIANSIKSGGLLPAACHMMGYLYEEREVPGFSYDQREALRLYKRAAKYGSIPGMKKVLYTLLLPQNMDRLSHESLQSLLFQYTQMAVENGCEEELKQLGDFYKYGTNKNKDELEAMKLYYKAALTGYNDINTCFSDTLGTNVELADLLVKNRLFSPQYAEAYSWLLAYNREFFNYEYDDPKRVELTDKLYKYQSRKYHGKPNKFAYKYFQYQRDCGMIAPFLAKDLDPYLDYMFDKFAMGDTLFDATEEIAKFLLPTTSNRVESNIDNDVRFNDASHVTEKIASNNTVYNFINQVASNFQINKVKLELEISRKLNRDEELDYSKIIITYDCKDKDTKEARIYEPTKVNKKARKLLLCLACQTSDKDKARRANNIASIMRGYKEEPSRLNAMLRSMFPNCGLPNKSCMINKSKGTIQVCLSIKDPTNKMYTELCTSCQYRPY